MVTHFPADSACNGEKASISADSMSFTKILCCESPVPNDERRFEFDGHEISCLELSSFTFLSKNFPDEANFSITQPLSNQVLSEFETILEAAECSSPPIVSLIFAAKSGTNSFVSLCFFTNSFPWCDPEIGTKSRENIESDTYVVECYCRPKTHLPQLTPVDGHSCRYTSDHYLWDG